VTTTTITSIIFTAGYTGTFSFGNQTLTLTGNTADFRTAGSITTAGGQLNLNNAGAQTFTPPATLTTFPNVVKSGAGTTTIQTNPVTLGRGVKDQMNLVISVTGLTNNTLYVPTVKITVTFTGFTTAYYVDSIPVKVYYGTGPGPN